MSLLVVVLLSGLLSVSAQCPTLGEIETLINTANPHRQACEAAAFNDPECTNYWTVAQQIVNKQTQYQVCREEAENDFRTALVGDEEGDIGLICKILSLRSFPLSRPYLSYF